ncbi:DUF924 domain-containing protein [Paracoccus sp. Z330]|uniref:DUF924 domain-containing protein n=1 Tax=Paracoccus onchidii TaxID=3017813 RepID=A0ABT4ZCZ3_9RHOB|nr:DUF924 family protein [Paracoccus onchidii]MDB6177155.1 DUF924 domain-containing protein [Paracoccus onchidii]
MTLKTPLDISNFWFAAEMQPYWFKKSDDIDRQIIQLFAETYEAAHAGRLSDWAHDCESALALVIVLDQFPRNMFRNSSRSYESNDLALTVARRALENGCDGKVDPTRRQFFYLPFMHSEDLDDQNKSVALYEALGNAHSLHFAKEHRDIIARFGRFPHRNAVLGRQNSPEEEAFLKTHTGF